MRCRLAATAALAILTATAAADDFERLEGRLLESIADRPEAEARARLSLGDFAALPNVLEGVRSPVLIVRTDRGNPCRLIAAPGFRPSPTDSGGLDVDPSPILILERFATFDAGGGNAPDRLATGAGVLLFDGFRYDLDTGQVVPEGQGGDLVFRVDDAEGPRLEPIDGARLFTLDEPPSFAEHPKGPSPGPVAPADYAGRFQLIADGTLSGMLDLAIDGRDVTGRFRSDDSGRSFEVRGAVVAEPEPSIRFAILFPRTRHEFDGRLFSEGKRAMAGTVVMTDRERAFYAIRDEGISGGVNPQ